MALNRTKSEKFREIRRNCGKIMMKVSTGTPPLDSGRHEVNQIPIDYQTGASQGLTTVIR